MTEETKNPWHFDKGISITTIISVIVAMIIFYSETQVMKAEIASLNKKVEILATDRLHKDTVNQMFANRDLQTQMLRDDITALKEDLKETNALLRRLIGATHITTDGGE